MSDLAPILARLTAVLGPHGEPEPIDGGITNRNYKVTFGESDYVVRLPGKDTDLLGIDRSAEWAATCAASQLGIAPPTGAMLDDPPCIVTRFVVGRPLEAADLRRAPTTAAVAAALRSMHDSGVELPSRFSSFEVVREYEALAKARGATVPDGFNRALRCAKAIQKTVHRSPEHDPVPCHNDLLAGNFIEGEQGLRLLDWEYAGMGDRYFDLGNFSVNNGLDDGERVALLEAYWNEPASPRRLAALNLMSYMSDFREAMWGVLQSVASDLDFDFMGYSRQHFERLRATAADPRFDRWLKEARGKNA